MKNWFLLIFIILMVIIYCYYPIKNGAPDCLFAEDVITCVEVCKMHKEIIGAH